MEAERISTAAGPSRWLVAQISEGVGKFGDSDAGGTQLSDHYSGGSVSKDRSIGKRSACGYGQRKHTEHGVARAGYVKKLPTVSTSFYARLPNSGICYLDVGGRNSDMPRRRFLEYAHAVSTACDHHRATAKMRQQRAAGLFK
jgi:hypothetical protein